MDKLRKFAFILFVICSVQECVDTASEEEIIAQTKYGKVRGTRRHISVKLPGGKSTLLYHSRYSGLQQIRTILGSAFFGFTNSY